MADSDQGSARTLRVFLCHSSNDKPAVRALCRRLQNDGFVPWLDEEQLLPGEDWNQKITKAVRASDVVIVCLSGSSMTKAGYVQKEIRQALDVADEKPPGTIFIIPLRIEACDVPERLGRWQWVNLFESSGYDMLIRALEARGGENTTATQPNQPRYVRLGISSYPPFAGEKEQFFDHLFERFFRLSRLSVEVRFDHSSNLFEALANNQLDFLFPHSCGVGQSMLVHSWATPICLGLGAVIHRRHASLKELVKKILCLQSRRGARLRPIVVRGEAGANHCLETLGFGDFEVTFVDHLDPRLLADSLRELSLKPEIPVVVVDEYASFQVLGHLGTEGTPVISLSGREAVRTDFARRELPRRFLGFACSRGQPKLRETIEQTFQLFLTTELETAAAALALLQLELMKELEQAAEFYVLPHAGPFAVESDKALRFQQARDWTLYTLALDKESIENYQQSSMPWGPVLKRARQIVQDDLAYDEETIEGQIRFFSTYKDRPLSNKSFHDLCRALDVPALHLTYAEQKYILEDNNMILRAIQNALKGLPVPPLQPFVAIIGSALDQTVAIAIYSLLVELVKRYNRELGDMNDASQETIAVIEDIQNIQNTFRASFSAVVLASHGKYQQHYIGCACLRPHERSEELELCNIMVLEPFQRLGVGGHILDRAHGFAREQGFKQLTVEVPPQLVDAVSYFERRGFKHQDWCRGRRGRVVLSYSTEISFASLTS